MNLALLSKPGLFTYIYLMNRVYREVMRCVRTNDVDEYIKDLPQVIDIFFGLPRCNYVRQGVLFLNPLKNSPLAAMEAFRQDAFSIRRTPNHHSRTAVHICLEQTGNRDAGSSSRGIVSVHDSPEAINHWTVFYS